MFSFTAETILHSRTMASGALLLLRDSRQVEPTPFLQSRQRPRPEFPPQTGDGGFWKYVSNMRTLRSLQFFYRLANKWSL